MNRVEQRGEDQREGGGGPDGKEVSQVAGVTKGGRWGAGEGGGWGNQKGDHREGGDQKGRRCQKGEGGWVTKGEVIRG